MVKILAKLEQFPGLSRLTTCGYKFVIFEISGLVSRHARERESPRADELVWERLADSPTTDPWCAVYGPAMGSCQHRKPALSHLKWHLA